ncbi:MAG: FRG domain-containing protein [Bacteroidota bacterium]
MQEKVSSFFFLLPKQNDNFEWLAIMQHHGAPTRLLDFTESLLIATYFSVNDATEDCCVWAINMHIIRDTLHAKKEVNYIKGEALKDDVNEVHIEFANKYIGSKTGIDNDKIPSVVIPLEPKICTERLSRQQGLFLMPTNCNKSFLENLTSIYLKSNFKLTKIPFKDFIKITNEERLNTKSKIIKINIPSALHEDILYSLKQMNITAETLFPGIDGLAKSLQQSHIRLW